MNGDSRPTGSRNAALFTLFGVALLTAGAVYFDDWYPTAVGSVLVLGGASSLLAHRLGWSGRSKRVPVALASLITGLLMAWHGYRLGSAFWVAFGLGIALPLALLMVFPERLVPVCGVLAVTFGGAGLLFVTTEGLVGGLVLVGWALGFVWLGYQNRPAAES